VTFRFTAAACPFPAARDTLLTGSQIASQGGNLPYARKPAVAGWFTGEGDGFRLLGTRCAACASVFFPREDVHCRNPHCAGGSLEEVPLSRKGRIWSYGMEVEAVPGVLYEDAETAWTVWHRRPTGVTE
jgi:hypothetical protein